MPIGGTPKEGWGKKKCVQRKDSFNEYLINKNGLLSAMLFLLRDGFLSSIGQQSTWWFLSTAQFDRVPQALLRVGTTRGWWHNGCHHVPIELCFLLKYHQHQTKARAPAEGNPFQIQTRSSTQVLQLIPRKAACYASRPLLRLFYYFFPSNGGV